MADPNDLTSLIQTAAAGPAAASGDAGSATQQPLPHLIAAAQFSAAAAAVKKRGRGLRFTKLIGPPQCAAPPSVRDTTGADGSFS